jgi:hypothetical protein
MSLSPGAATLHNAKMRCQVPRTFSGAIRASLPAFLALCAASHTAHGDWTVATSAALSHDNNVGNAQNYANVVADSSAAATVSLLQLIQIGENYSFAAGGNLGGQVYEHLSGLNDASLEGVLSLKRKWGLGALAPWARAGISLGRADYADGYRSASLYRASLEIGKRLDERVSLWAGYNFEHRHATPAEAELYGISGDVFSQSGRTLKAALQYSLTARISLGLGSLWRHGDVISTTTAANNIYVNSKAVAADPTFGPGAYAYKLDGTTYGARLGVDYSLSAHSLIGCGFQRLQTHAQGGNNYSDSMPQITWNYRF